MSRVPGPTALQLPRPGKVLRGLLWTVTALAIFWAVSVQWVHGGAEAFMALVFDPRLFLQGQVWRLFTAGLLSPPGGSGAVSHLVFTLVGLYFLSPDLERRWGGWRFSGFLLACLVGGYLLALLASLLPFGGELLHPAKIFGMGAAIMGIAVAWSRENANLEVRFFFLFPVKGRHLLSLTVGWCVLAVIFGDPSTEGVVAPFGGVLAGLLFGGSPSLVRATYLKWKLASLRRTAGGVSVQSILETSKRRSGATPPLRVVQGGVDDDLSRRPPPRDKRYLN
jgi:membrane associated rhomboid family serine protease